MVQVASTCAGSSLALEREILAKHSLRELALVEGPATPYSATRWDPRPKRSVP
jgi:hypothetical protein